MKTGEKFTDPLKLLKESEKMSKGITITGLMKESEKKDHISFSPTRQCTEWFDIPTDMIRETEFIGLKICMVPNEPVHHHPEVKLHLNEIESPLGGMLKSMIQNMETIAYKPHPDAPRDPVAPRTSSDPFRRPMIPDNPFAVQDERCSPIGECGAWGYYRGHFYTCAPDEYPCLESDGTVRCIKSPSCFRYYPTPIFP